MNNLLKYKQVYKSLSSNDRKMAFLAIVISSFSGLFDLVGISSILPLLSVLTNPEIINTNKYLILINSRLDFSEKEFVTFLAIFSFLIILINQLLRLISTWFILYLSENLLFKKSRDLFFYYLKRPYKLFLKSNTSHIVQKCTNYVNAGVAGYFTPFLIIISQLFTLFFIIFFLIIYNPVITLTLIFLLFTFYFLIFLNLKEKISNIGKATPDFFKKSSRVITDTFETFKEFKLSSNKTFFVKLFEKPAKKYRDANILINLFQQFPAFIIEVFSYLLILFLSLYLYFSLENFNEIIPLLGVITLSLRRLIPASQTIYSQISTIGFYKNSFEKIIQDLIKSKNYMENFSKNIDNTDYTFSEKIRFKNIFFGYNKKKIIKNLNLTIKKGSFVGITGLSGQGKTTFLDLFCGLLSQGKGDIFLDNKKMIKLENENWQKTISYAPQKGYLLNGSVIQNITYDTFKIDIKKIKKICKIVEISNFIEKDLPNKYNTLLGENGVRVSGGQAQRINLARCLCSNPEVLIMDEATNSIDSITEKKIIKSIRKHFPKLTIIFVSHRINILSHTDKILFFDKGTVKTEGKYSDLKNKSKIFKQLSFFAKDIKR